MTTSEPDYIIAFLPSDGSWCQQDFPHMTLVWGPVGTRSDAQFNDLVKDAISASRITRAFSLPVTGVQELGDPPVDALIFYPTPQLLLAYNLVKRWNGSEFTDYLPHATIGPAGSAAQMTMPQNVWPDVNGNTPNKGLPSILWFNRIAIGWGDKKIAFNIDY
jgi:hypothetical protein